MTYYLLKKKTQTQKQRSTESNPRPHTQQSNLSEKFRKNQIEKNLTKIIYSNM